MANFCGHGDLDTVNPVQLNLVDLPTDVLLWIFKFCDPVTLRCLSNTCKRLNAVVSEDSVWVKKSNAALITNQTSDVVLKRSFSKLKAKEKCRISANWRHGYYKEKIHSTSVKYMPWLWLESRMLWISQGRNILGLRRQRDGIDWHSRHIVIKTSHTDDISRFVLTDNVIFSGGKDKYICAWSTDFNKLLFSQRSNHTQGIQGIDCKRGTLVSGSKDGTVKVWRVEDGWGSLHCGCTVKVSDRVWSVAMDPSLSCIAAGSAGYYGVHPLHLYDLDRGEERPMAKSVVKNGAAVFDIQWECPNTLVTCGFDTILRLWDLRVGCCVASWADPFGAPGYCLATDHDRSILCGTATHGRVQFWDKRSPLSVQAFFGRGVASSPVYSLSFDPSQLFIAQDCCINVLNFSHHLEPDAQYADYTSFWAKGNGQPSRQAL